MVGTCATGCSTITGAVNSLQSLFAATLTLVGVCGNFFTPSLRAMLIDGITGAGCFALSRIFGCGWDALELLLVSSSRFERIIVRFES